MTGPGAGVHAWFVLFGLPFRCGPGGLGKRGKRGRASPNVQTADSHDRIAFGAWRVGLRLALNFLDGSTVLYCTMYCVLCTEGSRRVDSLGGAQVFRILKVPG